ncbi:MAG: zinc ABC transporter substrate-binding protein [Silicimonas sp.]|nr:zinc ABC transporter substrate-binding protein [Silicimonas sp.]
MRHILAFIAASLAAPSTADAPKVAADILPVHSLVARVMEGVGAPELILPPGADPHGYSMRPSEAAALEESDAVFWIGPALTPWLEKPLSVLSGKAERVALLDAPGTVLREVSEDGDALQDEHGDADHDEHDHGPIDSHAWLDPVNARTWIAIIADTLSSIDPENGDAYRANSADAQAELDELVGAMTHSLAPSKGQRFAVYHDAYGYLQARFGLEDALSLLSHEAERPSPARIGQLREIVNKEGIERVFVEPNVNVGLLEAVIEGAPVTICQIDPIGVSIAAGPSLYWQMMTDLAETIGSCGNP